DRFPNPFPHHPFDRIAPERFHFSAVHHPAIAAHGVILRRPPASGRELWINSPENEAFFLFHQSTDTTRMDARQQKALVIAATARIEKRAEGWRVPSQSRHGASYTVAMAAGSTRCTCPDFEERQLPCKHSI